MHPRPFPSTGLMRMHPLVTHYIARAGKSEGVYDRLRAKK